MLSISRYLLNEEFVPRNYVKGQLNANIASAQNVNIAAKQHYAQHHPELKGNDLTQGYIKDVSNNGGGQAYLDAHANHINPTVAMAH